MTNEWARTVDHLRAENRDLRRELLNMAVEKERAKPGGPVVAVLVTSILWLTMFGGYWAVYQRPSVAAAQPVALTMVERAVCDRMKPEYGSTLVTTEWGAYWTKKDGGKLMCVRR